MANDTNVKIAVDRILSRKASEITKSFLEELFAGYHDKETNTFKDAPYAPNEHFTLTPDMYQWCKESIDTTLGKLCFNRYVLEATELIGIVGYWNTPIDEDGMGDLKTEINEFAINDKIDTETLGDFYDHLDAMGFWVSSFIAPSVTHTLICPQKNVNQRKAELFKEYEAELNSDNPTTQILTANKIEKELMGMVKENIKDDFGYDLYKSKSANLNNNYKVINVMRGAVYNDATKKYDVVRNSCMDGITKRDIPAFGNSIVAGAYPSALGTAEAGYMSKIVLALMQSERIDPDIHSDCGTTKTIPFYVTKKNAKYVLDRYIKVGGKRVLTTRDNIKQYLDTTIELYSPQCCLNDTICEKCGGRVFHNMNVTNVGLLTTQFTMKLLNLKLKSKHDLSQHADIIPIKFIFNKETPNAYVDDGILKCKTSMKLFIPKALEESAGFMNETTFITCLGVFPVKFYDNNGNEIESNIMTFPAVLDFKVYSDVQEDSEYNIVSYEPESEICNTAINQRVENVEYYLNTVYFNSKIPLLPYDMMTNMLFRCMQLNSKDLNAPSIVYEMLARRVCRYNNDTFAKAYGYSNDVDPMSYTKVNFRTAVQNAGLAQSMMFQDMSTSINVALSMTLDGKKEVETPFEKIIKA